MITDYIDYTDGKEGVMGNVEFPSMHGPWYPSTFKKVKMLSRESIQLFQSRIYKDYGASKSD